MFRYIASWIATFFKAFVVMMIWNMLVVPAGVMALPFYSWVGITIVFGLLRLSSSDVAPIVDKRQTMGESEFKEYVDRVTSMTSWLTGFCSIAALVVLYFFKMFMGI